MNKIIAKRPICVTMKLAGGNTANANVGFIIFKSMIFFLFPAPSNTDFGGQFSNVFIIFKISPKFSLNARFFRDNFAQNCDGRRDVTPRAAPYY